MKIIISGGGTGGHIYPAIAIANELKSRHAEAEILFVGAKGKMEMEKVPKAGYEIVGLPIRGLERRLSLANLAFPLKLAKSLNQARQVIKQFRPDVAVGVGGYASAPLLFMAARAGIPYLIQEQNSYAGLSNKWLAKHAEKICVAYDNMEAFFPKDKLLMTGNPVRQDILDIESKKAEAQIFFKLNPNKKTLLVVGGSLGARSINQAVSAGLSQLQAAGLQIIWQTGKNSYEAAPNEAEELSKGNVQKHQFIYEMSLAYAAADIIISRAGALAISELAIVGKPVILLPFPFASEDHQRKNALALVEKEAAALVEDKAAAQELIPVTLKLLKNEGQQATFAQNIRQFARPQAAQDIAIAVEHLSK